MNRQFDPNVERLLRTPMPAPQQVAMVQLPMRWQNGAPLLYRGEQRVIQYPIGAPLTPATGDRMRLPDDDGKPFLVEIMARTWELAGNGGGAVWLVVSSIEEG